jgi:hypothetical protein
MILTGESRRTRRKKSFGVKKIKELE